MVSIDCIRSLCYNLIGKYYFKCCLMWGFMKWYKVILDINRMRDASGSKMLYYAIRNLALYAIGLGLFLGGVLAYESNEIASIALLAVGGLCMIIVTLYQFLLVGFISAKIIRDDDKSKNIASLLITLFSIVIVAVLVFLMINSIL